MGYSTKDFYYKICEIISLKKQTNLRLNKIEEIITSYGTVPIQEKDKNSQAPKEGVVPTEEISKWMGKHEIMIYLKISETTYYRWRKSGKLVPSVAFGEDRYLKEDVIALLSSR